MSDTEEITLRLLRETRAEMTARFDGIDHRLHRIEQRLGAAPADRLESAVRTERDPSHPEE